MSRGGRDDQNGKEPKQNASGQDQKAKLHKVTIGFPSRLAGPQVCDFNQFVCNAMRATTITCSRNQRSQLLRRRIKQVVSSRQLQDGFHDPVRRFLKWGYTESRQFTDE